MRLNSATEHAEISDSITTTSTFRIKASAKAFSILSSGLYSDKILAIVRELSTNAYDSHVAANNVTTPFDVHLPSVLDPNFKIRDYGTGLSKDDVVTIYTTYFESTKTESDDYVGALGLGSKSPFCYTQNFIIESYKDGMVYTFGAFLSNDGIPSVALMSETETDQPNGVSITVPVKKNDFYTFESKARAVYLAFDCKPNFICGTEFEWPEKTEVFDNVWCYKAHKMSYGLSNINIRQGSVIYPLQVYSYDFNIPILSHVASSNPYIIDVPIGTADITASREELSYDDATVENLSKILSHIESNLKQRYTEMVSESTVADVLGLDVAVCKIVRDTIAEKFPFIQNTLYYSKCINYTHEIFKGIKPMIPRKSTLEYADTILYHPLDNKTIFYYSNELKGKKSKIIKYIRDFHKSGSVVHEDAVPILKDILTGFEFVDIEKKIVELYAKDSIATDCVVYEKKPVKCKIYRNGYFEETEFPSTISGTDVAVLINRNVYSDKEGTKLISNFDIIDFLSSRGATIYGINQTIKNKIVGITYLSDTDLKSYIKPEMYETWIRFHIANTYIGSSMYWRSNERISTLIREKLYQKFNISPTGDMDCIPSSIEYIDKDLYDRFIADKAAIDEESKLLIEKYSPLRHISLNSTDDRVETLFNKVIELIEKGEL